MSLRYVWEKWNTKEGIVTGQSYTSISSNITSSWRPSGDEHCADRSNSLVITHDNAVSSNVRLANPTTSIYSDQYGSATISSGVYFSLYGAQGSHNITTDKITYYTYKSTGTVTFSYSYERDNDPEKWVFQPKATGNFVRMIVGTVKGSTSYGNVTSGNRSGYERRWS